MKHVYFLKYNNYANRIFKQGQALQDYLGVDGVNKISEIKKCTLWNPNDGITTTLPTPQNVNFSTEPDYCIVTDEYGTIDSRWFVVETVRLLSGQYQCYLKRDVFADAWDELMESTCQIHRAIVLNDNPLIFNPEPITVNELIGSETAIKDKTGVPWIVFYSAGLPAQETNYEPEKLAYNHTTANKATWESTREFNFIPENLESIQINLKWNKRNTASAGFLHLIPGGMDTYNDPGAYFMALDSVPEFTNPTSIDFNGALSAFKTQFTLKSAEEAAAIVAMDGDILYDSTEQKYYKIHATVTTTSTVQAAIAINGSDTFEWAKTTIQTKTNIPVSETIIPGYIVTMYRYAATSITLEEMTSESAVDFKVPQHSVKPNDAPYYMWCMPYGEIEMVVNGNSVIANPTLNLSIASWFANRNSSDSTFDVQILPFCPLPDEYIDPSDGHIVVDNDNEITDTDTITQTASPHAIRGFIFACPSCSFTRQIRYQYPRAYLFAENNKIGDICEKDRLYSPNYASSFEFSSSRNGGVFGFNIRCTYMPIQPYIRIAPIWSGLYGKEKYDKDPRGLICSGNYSIARLNDAWVQYQEQNKNYEAIFNREIQHMDVERKYQKINEVAGAISGTFTGAATGAAAGAMAGGPVGAAVGGVVGGAGAAITGGIDIENAEKLFQEGKSYATDLHKMQLGNVQAMPRTLAKTTAFNVDNRYFPIYVRYIPTTKEATLVDEYINIHSMTVDVAGKPKDYIYNRYSRNNSAPYTDKGFISGSIIRIETTHDTHYVDELNKEFTKGVYLR